MIGIMNKRDAVSPNLPEHGSNNLNFNQVLYLQQFFSSDPSPQSLKPSHILARLAHLLLSHSKGWGRSLQGSENNSNLNTFSWSKHGSYIMVSIIPDPKPNTKVSEKRVLCGSVVQWRFCNLSYGVQNFLWECPCVRHFRALA